MQHKKANGEQSVHRGYSEGLDKLDLTLATPAAVPGRLLSTAEISSKIFLLIEINLSCPHID